MSDKKSKNFIWILEASLISSFRGSGSMSQSYILPKNQVKIKIKDIAGGKLWIILRGNWGDSLMGCLHVNMVEIFEDGLNIGDYYLSITQSKSFFTFSNYIPIDSKFLVKSTSENTLGVFWANESIVLELWQVVSKNIFKKLKPPNKAILDQIDYHLSSPLNLTSEKIEKLMAATISVFTLNDIWASLKLPPFANFAFEKLKAIDENFENMDLGTSLAQIDPTVRKISKKPNNMLEGDWLKKDTPSIDLFLTPIDPQKIFARSFVAKEHNFDLIPSLEKTESAEKRHQDMLRDISERVIFLGKKPLQSTSIDLCVEGTNKLFLFELKSISRANFFSQCSKGVFQLKCYENAILEKKNINSNSSLIIETTNSRELDSYIEKIIASFSLNLFIYYSEKTWPSKLKNSTLTFDSLFT